MTKNLREANGDSVVVEEHEIRRASVELVRSGFLVEPSSAVAYAGYRKQLLERKIQQDADTVIVLTGCGLKTMLESF
jgi:threonine synthase